MMLTTKALEYAQEVVREYERFKETEVEYYDNNAEAFRALLEYIDMCHAIDRKRNKKVKSLIAEVERLKRGREIFLEQITQLFGEIERLRGNLKTVEVLTSCPDTKDFVKRALNGKVTIEI
jgi:hypothetical protein